MPLLNADVLQTKGEHELAHLLLSCLSQSYIHSTPSSPANSLPPQLAVPWCQVSDKLGLPPILVHSTISLCNWRKLDPSGPMVLDNLNLLYSLDSSRDLEVFFLIPVLVELCSVPAVLAILTTQELLAQGDQDHLQIHLDTITR